MKKALLQTLFHKLFAKVKYMYKKLLNGMAERNESIVAVHDLDYFLKTLTGVIHIGANIGQERDLYAKYDLDVVWVEPIPKIFESLIVNLKEYPRQRAYQYLVADKDGEEYEFHVSNNAGLSSSILNLYHHKDIWPDVYFEHTITLASITLRSLVEKEGIDIQKYDALIMDTQGAELFILQGAGDLLSKFKFIKLEAPDFESYENCPLIVDIENFLRPYGFHEYSRNKFAIRSKGGSYYDVLYVRDANI